MKTVITFLKNVPRPLNVLSTATSIVRIWFSWCLRGFVRFGSIVVKCTSAILFLTVDWRQLSPAESGNNTEQQQQQQQQTNKIRSGVVRRIDLLVGGWQLPTGSANPGWPDLKSKLSYSFQTRLYKAGRVTLALGKPWRSGWFTEAL